jgi:hypothetical protein
VYDDVPDDDFEPRDRSEYMKEYYKRKQNEKGRICFVCGEKCKGEMLKMARKNFCGASCVKEYLFKMNENRMAKIIV